MLAQPTDELFQPTASGRPVSALYGSTRTGLARGRAVSRFHEGIDIRCKRRDKRSRPLDAVLAAADGTVAYVNRIAGNSSYGIYLVLTHEDRIGPVYSLYAHLARVAPGIRLGKTVRLGARLGTMGNTSTLGIARARSHLHLEIGLIVNTAFHDWLKTALPDQDSLHDIYHGWNLTGLDPLALFRRMHGTKRLDLLRYLTELPVAFTLVANAGPTDIDYFLRYPALWQGPGAPSGRVLLAVSEGGAILHGRTIQAAHGAKPESHRPEVLEVNETALGRNGRHLIRKAGAAWVLTDHGRRWLQILLYHPTSGT